MGKADEGEADREKEEKDRELLDAVIEMLKRRGILDEPEMDAKKRVRSEEKEDEKQLPQYGGPAAAVPDDRVDAGMLSGRSGGRAGKAL